MTKDQIAKQRNDLFDAVAALLRMTADPDPTHPSWTTTRAKAAALYQRVQND